MRTGAELVVISADDPAAMVRHSRGVPRAGLSRSPPTRPSRSPGCPARSCAQLIEGAILLFTNDYEKSLLESKTGLTEAEVLARVGVRVTTLGKDGVEIVRPGESGSTSRWPASGRRSTRPGSATVSGPVCWPGAPGAWRWERSAQVGCLLATMVLETVGTQEYQVTSEDFAIRLADSYGEDAANEVAPFLESMPALNVIRPCTRPRNSAGCNSTPCNRSDQSLTG